MNRAIIPLLSGLLFGAGVCVSGMIRPSKVLGFLDFGGNWDPSLLVVMAVALTLHVIAWRIVKAMRRPRFGDAFPGPADKTIDLRLIGGAALFGVGWGISGFCPGPAILSVLSGASVSLVFVGTMAIGMLIVSALRWNRTDHDD